MRSIGHLLLGALVTLAPALFSQEAGAADASRYLGNRVGQGITNIGLTLRQALALGIDLRGKPVNIGSDICGDLKVTTVSTCKIVTDATCLSSCTPSNF